MGIFSSLYLEAHRGSFQSSVSESLPDNAEKLLFSARDFEKIHWEEKFKEFESGGKLFDVISIEKTKEGFEIYCVNDSEEESIIAIFREWKKTNFPVNKTKIQLQPLFFSNSSIDLKCQNPVATIDFSLQAIHYDSEQVQVPSPPPRSKSSS